jgi:hypothetical protein
MLRFVFALSIVAASLGASSAQHQPYAGLQARPVKALSDQQIADLKSGRGMGLALAAELNGYPGPLHVIELAEQLGLTAEQRTRVRALFNGMKAEAVALGERLITQETELDRQFAMKSATPASLESATAAIGETQGALRNVHLKYHLATLDMLTSAQVSRYAELRGYQGRAQQHSPRHHK